MTTITRINPQPTAYSAAWKVSSTSSAGTALTNDMSVPAGTYVVTLSVPQVSAATSVGIHGANASGGADLGLNIWANVPSGYSQVSAIVTLSVAAKLKGIAGASASVSYSNTTRGGIKAVRLL